MTCTGGNTEWILLMSVRIAAPCYTMQSCELRSRHGIVYTFYFPLLEYNLIQHLREAFKKKRQKKLNFFNLGLTPWRSKTLKNLGYPPLKVPYRRSSLKNELFNFLGNKTFLVFFFLKASLNLISVFSVVVKVNLHPLPVFANLL